MQNPPKSADVRLAIYRHVVESTQIHTPATLAQRFDTSPNVIGEILRKLAEQDDALVLLPGSPYIWMAEPFSATPTDYPVTAHDGRQWFGNCIWDALAIASLVNTPTKIATRCPQSGAALGLSTEDGHLSGDTEATVHFAVPARDWWQSIGFT